MEADTMDSDQQRRRGVRQSNTPSPSHHGPQRPGTPPPMHVSPRRENMTGLTPTHTREAARSPTRQTWEHSRSTSLQVPLQPRSPYLTPTRSTFGNEYVPPSVAVDPQPSTSNYQTYQRRPTFTHAQDVPISTIRRSISGILEENVDAVAMKELEDKIEMMVIPSPPSDECGPVPPPSPFANREEKVDKPISIWRDPKRYFSKISSKKRCKQFHHTEQDINKTRGSNESALKEFMHETCPCLALCPRLRTLLQIHEDFILRRHKAGPYAADAEEPTNAAEGGMRIGRAFMVSVNNISPRDTCLRVTFTKHCSLNEQSLSKFTMYDGFKGIKIIGSEAFIVFTRDESAVMAMHSLNGMMVNLEHTMQVESTTLTEVKKAASMHLQVNLPMQLPCQFDMTLSEAELSYMAKSLGEECRRREARRGGRRRLGDERLMLAARSQAVPEEDTQQLCCARGPKITEL